MKGLSILEPFHVCFERMAARVWRNGRESLCGRTNIVSDAVDPQGAHRARNTRTYKLTHTSAANSQTAATDSDRSTHTHTRGARTLTHACAHTHTQLQQQTLTHAHTRTRAARARSHVRTHARTHTHTHTNARIQGHARTHAHPHTHAQTHTLTRARAHTHSEHDSGARHVAIYPCARACKTTPLWHRLAHRRQSYRQRTRASGAHAGQTLQRLLCVTCGRRRTSAMAGPVPWRTSAMAVQRQCEHGSPPARG